MFLSETLDYKQFWRHCFSITRWTFSEGSSWVATTWRQSEKKRKTKNSLFWVMAASCFKKGMRNGINGSNGLSFVREPWDVFAAFNSSHQKQPIFCWLMNSFVQINDAKHLLSNVIKIYEVQQRTVRIVAKKLIWQRNFANTSSARTSALWSHTRNKIRHTERM